MVKMKTPVVLRIRSSDSVYYSLKGDGTASISYCLPQGFDVTQPHAIKLLYVNGPSKPVFCHCNFIQLQAFNMGPSNILGTSMPGTNTYVPVGTNYVPAVGWITIENMDGSPIEELEDINLALHLVPIDQLSLWCN